MSLTKEQKAVFIDEIGEMLDASPAIYLTNYEGLTVAQADDLRNRFREAGVQYKVLKNTLVRLSMEKREGYEDLYQYLHGATAIAFSEEPAAPARVIEKFVKDTKNEKLQFKGAYVDGGIFHTDALDMLTKLKSKDEILGDVIGLLLSPITNVVGGLQAAGGNLVGALQTIAEREEA